MPVQALNSTYEQIRDKLRTNTFLQKFNGVKP